ncbi:hypothetical protein RhiirA4_451660 [Rhizophagus irregularis]|uniref:Uncharacterized protein n=1 Tax=Rhizophagus irregularis TaxID=588596 RepID=A0A2I1FW77_9GLOM|nr:hypothetical protein RhiirA4_451660 [Rhizophagus irregularis]
MDQMYSLPQLKGYLPTKYYKEWSFFVQAVQLCQKIASIKRNGPCCITWQFPIELVYAYQKLLPEKTIKAYHGLVFASDDI